MVEFGVVKCFDEKKEFGFLFVLGKDGKKTREEVFFHFSDGRGVGKNDQAPTFLSERPDPRLQYPRKGNLLVFERVAAEKGPKARRWSYAEQWKSHGGKIPKVNQQPAAR